MNVYAFDVDDTLECSDGPISLEHLERLAHEVGLCGNWARVVQTTPGWQRFVSFLGPIGITKAEFLRQLSTHIPADGYVMVGNVLGVSGRSDDAGAASEAGWRFIREADFQGGIR
jgi:hypothetical protein